MDRLSSKGIRLLALVPSDTSVKRFNFRNVWWGLSGLRFLQFSCISHSKSNYIFDCKWVHTFPYWRTIWDPSIISKQCLCTDNAAKTLWTTTLFIYSTNSSCTVYVLCFTSCWFWLMSSISCLTSSPLNFKTPSWLKAQLVVCATGWHFSCVLHFPWETIRLFASGEWTMKGRTREREVEVEVRVCLWMCANGRQWRLRFLGQASGHFGCSGNPVLAGLLGNNPLLFQMI